MKYQCIDGNGEIEIEATSAKEAAQEFADGGDWGENEKTFWVSVRVTDESGESETIKIQVDPNEPECDGDDGHDWKSPLSIVGGCRENPGVFGHGGGVKITCVCRHCGRYEITDTWAQDSEDGEQGLTSTEYRDADEISSEWVESQKTEAI